MTCSRPPRARRGLPLGNQTSQFFAKVYLTPLDHYVQHELAPRCYIRYVEDFVLLGNAKHVLDESRGEIEELLDEMRLQSG